MSYVAFNYSSTNLTAYLFLVTMIYYEETHLYQDNVTSQAAILNRHVRCLFRLTFFISNHTLSYKYNEMSTLLSFLARQTYFGWAITITLLPLCRRRHHTFTLEHARPCY